MTELVRSSHNVFKIKYHVVFCIKYRKDLFLEEKYVATIKQVCKDIEDRFYLLFETIEEFDEASQRQQRYSNIGVLGTLAGALITAAGVALYDLKSS